MNNLSKIGLGVLTTLATIAPGAQAGYVSGGYHFMSGDDFGPRYEAQATQFLKGLDELGVSVIDGTKNELPQCENKTLGFYSGHYNVMAICTQGVPNWLKFETLVHETVHVIQDARDGIDNDSLEAGNTSYLGRLVDGLDDNRVELIEGSYDRSHWALEVEAFYFETRPSVVLDELDRWVF